MTTLLKRALFVSLPLLGACSEPVTPNSPSVALVAPAGGNTTSVASITGSVFDTAARPLPGAKVEVLDGPSAGASALVDRNGVVVLSGQFDSSTRFRASMTGHETLVATWTCSVANCANNARPWFGFQLRPLLVPVDLAGNYTMTLTAHSSCGALPADARSRSYAITLTKRFRDGTADLLGFDAAIHAGDVVDSLREFRVGIAGDFINIYFRRGDGDEPGLLEHLDGDRYVGFTGNVAGTVNAAGDRSIVTFSGSVDNFVLRQAPSFPFLLSNVVAKDSCASTEHSLTLTRMP